MHSNKQVLIYTQLDMRSAVQGLAVLCSKQMTNVLIASPPSLT